MEVEQAQRMIAEYQEAEVRLDVNFDTLVRGVLLYPEVHGLCKHPVVLLFLLLLNETGHTYSPVTSNSVIHQT